MRCLKSPYSNTLFAFAGLTACLKRFLEKYQETERRNEMLQVKMCACVYICVHTVEMGVGEPLTTTGERGGKVKRASVETR